MASRCINALNELDAISDKIFYKYSKSRFKSEIEGRIRASRSKLERSSSLDRNNCTSKRKSSCFSFNSHVTSDSCNVLKTRATKSAVNPKISQPKEKEHKERAKTTSYCRKRANKPPFKGHPKTKEEENKSNKINTRVPSVYGKRMPEEEKSKPENWFNFEDGMKMGVIDSFACDELKKKALCYTLDIKESKPVPKLLHHRLEVRIGQNGEVGNMQDAELKDNDLSESKNTNTFQPIPLSWEEQLNWKNARIKSPRPPRQQQTQDESLCETRPVIFHPQERPSTISIDTVDLNDTSASYRMYLERRLLVSDRANLMCGGKYITSVEVEDARDEIEEEKRLTALNLSLKTYDLDADRMDMSTTIDNIENIYPRRSAASKSSSMGNTEGEFVDNTVNKLVENSENDPLSLDSRSQDIAQLVNSDKTEKLNKKVSFKDQLEITDKFDGVNIQDASIDQVREANISAARLKERPKSSKERSEFLLRQVSKPKRPYTAPPCSPRVTRDENLESEIARHFNLAPIRVPSSEVLGEQDNSNTKGKLFNKFEDSKFESGEEINSCDKTSEGQTTMRVSVACKSAPSSRATPRLEEGITRSLSSTSSRSSKNKYVPPEPLAVFADSPMELPPNLPPAKALVELRKKIREDLAKETADLQLDIQQLYLKHHASA